MFVSIAICTWNRAVLLDKTLQQLRSVNVPAGLTWEIVVVNNNCSDNTDEIAARHSGALPLRLLHERTPGLSNARNCALNHIKSDWVLWTDDDVLADQRWLEAFIATAKRQPEAGAIGGPIDPWFLETPSPDLLQAFPVLRSGFVGIDYGQEERPLEVEESIWGANMAYRSSACGGMRFDPNLGRVKDSLTSGEDHDFLSRVRQRGHAVMYSPAMRVRHYVDPMRMTERYLLDFYESLGVTTVRMGTLPGRRILGVPAWVLRRWVETAVLSRYYSVRGRSVDRLISLREHHRCRGMLKALFRGQRPATAAI